MPDETPLLQGKYRTESLLSTTPSSTVYAATDERLGTKVVVKQLAGVPATSAPDREAFEQSARLLARLRHPALARVLDYFVEDDRPYLVLDYIPGDTLHGLLGPSPHGFPPQQVLAWADQLLEALEYLHTQDPPVVHHDIKPANIKLTEHGEVVLLDFGSARVRPLAPEEDDSLRPFPGGTWSYAPIEQLLCKPTDARTDLYALGATLYRLLTHRVPVDAFSRASARNKSVPDPDPLVPANELCEQVSEPLANVLNRAMAVDAADRFESAAEMRRDLAGLLKPAPPRTSAAPKVPEQAVCVFLSTVTPHTDLQGRFINHLVAELEKMGIVVLFATPDQFDWRDPLRVSRELITRSQGVVVLGLERTHVYFLREKEGSSEQTEAHDRKYTSSWLHMEAGIANALGRDVFVLCQHDLCSDGVFDRHWNTYPVTELKTLDGDSPELTAFLTRVRAWARDRQGETAVLEPRRAPPKNGQPPD